LHSAIPNKQPPPSPLSNAITLDPQAAASELVERFKTTSAVKVHWRLRIVDELGLPTGALRPGGMLPAGDLRQLLSRDAIDPPCPPQSGNAYARSFLERVMPVGEAMYRTGGADTLLSALAIAHGPVAAIAAVMGTYRIHSSSHWTGQSFATRLRMGYDRFEHICQVLALWCRKFDLPVTPERWLAHSWFALTRDAVQRRLIERRHPEPQAGERVADGGNDLVHRVRIGDGLEGRSAP